MVQRALKIETVLPKIKELPTLPDVVFKVNEVVNDPSTSASDLETVISRDQAIAAKILRLVNSAFYGLPGRVDTLSRAIPLLGFSTVRNLVMSLSIFNISSVADFDMKMFWRHSFASSTATKAIALTDGIPDAESQSLAGLLHDMGKIVLFQHFVKEYQAVFKLMEQRKLSFIQAEKTLYATNHAEVGEALAMQWGFPPNISAAIAHHHNPENAGDFADFASVCASANVITQPRDEGFIIDLGFSEVKELCEGFHPLSEKAFLSVSRELGKQMQFFENFIDRMEAFRRPSPILQDEVSRTKGDSIWKLPEKKT
ncbi:MAG TPA: HDOD domain-containing protein [Firmicutes bacterium]|nr:HDOD domain-containing protein [Bacillota bacterium]